MAPYDENQIDADDLVIRRINPQQHVVWDENRGCRRISSKVFSPSSGRNDGMSVDIEQLMLSDGVDPRHYVTTPVFMGSVAFSAGAARALGLLVGYDPIPKNPYHGEVWGGCRPNRFSRRQKKGLTEASRWYVELDGVDIV
jgi:hypothetical protein